MQADVTVRSADGTDTDVRVRTSGDPTWAQLCDALRQAGVDAEPGWVDGRKIDLAAPVGELVSGSVLSALPSVPQALPPRLEVVGGLESDRGIALRHGTIAVGRSSDCELVLLDPRVSRHHAIVVTTAAGTTVRDVGSTSGVQIDGAPIRAAHPIPPGTLLRLGDTYLSIAAGERTDLAPHREDVVFDWPDEPPDGHPIPVQLAAAIVPGVVGVVLALVLHSVELLAFALLSPVAMLATAIAERIRGRRVSRRRRRQLRREREVVRAQLRRAMDEEVERRRAAHPDPARLRRRVRDGGAEPHAASRTPTIRVRIGLASLPSSVGVCRDGTVESAGPLLDVPVTLDLAAETLIIVAPRRLAAAASRWLILQIAATTHPDDVEFAICTVAPAQWRWMRWLPHLRSLVATTPKARDELLDLLAARRDDNAPSPRHVVVLADEPTCAGRLAALAKNAHSVSAIVLSGRIGPNASAATTLRFGCDALAQAHLGAVDCVVDGVGTGWAESFARELAGRLSGHAAGGRVPQSCELSELGLRASATAITAAWQQSPSRPRALVGIGPGGPVELDLDRDGPHALIAGTTGAGKSELLQTLLVSLTAHSPPDELTLLLFDFKGGAAFAPLADLPHTVGLVTDLDEHLSRRMLTALRSELALRERLLAAAGVADRAGYRATGATLPRLVLVVDEFAALAEQLPDFVPGLVGVAQRGRSLGLHLILATQRPGGVVSAEIRANTDLRIALRTTSAAESIDVIDDPAAASIDPATPGRAYVRSGPRLQVVQCARVGNAASDEAVRVQRLDDWNRPMRQPTPEPTNALLGGFPRAIRAAAAGRPAPRRPWLPPLPEHVSSDMIPTAAREAMTVPIGLADRPDLQRYDVEAVHLGTGGGLVFTGGPRSGRTSALLSLITSAARQLEPDELEVHAIIDGAAAAIVDQLPHSGTVTALRDGGQLAAELLTRLARRSQERASAYPATVLLIDDWDAWCAASDTLDHGRSVETVLALIRAGPSTHTTVVVAGGRTTMTPRLTALASARYVLRLTDTAEYPVAGVDPRDVPAVMPVGRAINGDGIEVQLLDPAEAAHDAATCRSRWRRPPDRLRLRPLPDRITSSALSAAPLLPDGRWLLGVGGDAAVPIGVDPTAGTRRILVAGPPGSGRSNVLALLCAQCAPGTVSAIASPTSPLAAAATHAAARVIDPATVADPDAALPDRCDVLFIDDADERLAEPFGQACADWIPRHPDSVVVAATRTDTLAIAPHEPIAEVRRAGGGVVVLQPGPLDTHLVGPLASRAAGALPGRGVLLPDPAWRLGSRPVPLQVALADPDDRVSACADTRGRSAARRSL